MIKVRWYKIAIAACFFAPFYTLRVTDALFTVSDLFFLLAFTVMIIRGPRLRNQHTLQNLSSLTWLLGAILILVGLLVAHIFSGADINKTMAAVAHYAFGYIMVFIVISLAPPETVSRAMYAFVAGLMTVVAVGASLYYLAPNIYNFMVAQEIFISMNRLGSFMGPNGLAKTIALSLPMALWFAMRQKSRPFGIAACCVFLIGLLGAASNGGLISALTGIAIYLTLVTVLQPRLLQRLVPLIVAGAIAGVGFIASPLAGPVGTTFDRVASTLLAGDVDGAGSYRVKITMMAEATDTLKELPIGGFGAGQSRLDTALGEPIHNTYLLLWYEGSILALIGIILIVLAPVGYAVTTLVSTRSHTAKSVAIVTLATSLVFALNLMTNTSSYARFEFLPVILTVAMLAKLSHPFNTGSTS